MHPSTSRYQLVEDLFQRALDQPRQRRAAFVRTQSSGDFSLQREVEDLLEHYEQARDSFLNDPAHELQSTQGGRLRPPEHVGGYRILEELGEGGMGIVYRAEQRSPRREVALKMIRAAAFGRNVQRRFEFEAAVLGRLKHPGIAQIYEAGVFERGAESQPFFAMELVEGTPLLQFVKERELSVRARLELFTDICHAVHHAHQKGIIHRDLKPANILVVVEQGPGASHDDPASRPASPSNNSAVVPKILDFGVARSIDADIQSTTLRTGVGQLVGTLAYMSPEQIEGQADRLDTRSDVYSLGVILYELLTGRLPYDVNAATVPNAARIIVEQEPAPLATINRALRGDLNTIVLKTLEKEPQRRYQSASELAADIRAHLSDEPISARPASTLYRASKFSRRHKGFVGGIMTALLALSLGTVVATSSALNEAKQRRIAVRNESRARLAATKAQRVSEFLQSIFAASDPRESLGRNISVREVLEEAERRVDSELANEPGIAAIVHSTIGNSLSGLGDYAAARRHFEAALELNTQCYGTSHAEVAGSMTDLARVDYSTGDYGQGETLCRDALSMLDELPETDRLGAANTTLTLASNLISQGRHAEAAKLARQALQWRRTLLGDDSPDVAASHTVLAQALIESDFAEAESHLRAAVEIYRRGQRPNLSYALNQWAVLLRRQDRLADAESLYCEALAFDRTIYGEQHAIVAQDLIYLAQLLADKGEFAQAEAMYEESLTVTRATRGDRNRNVATALIGRARCRFQRGDGEGAEADLLEALEIYRSLFGDDNRDVATTLNNLGHVQSARGDYDAAESYMREALDIYRSIHGNVHMFVARSLYSLANVVKSKGDLKQAEALLRESLAVFRSLFGDRHESVAQCLVDLAEIVERCESSRAAEPLLTEAVQILGQLLPFHADRYADAADRLSRLRIDQERWEEAGAVLLDALDALQETGIDQDAKIDGARQKTIHSLAALYDAWGKPLQASKYRNMISEAASRPQD